MISEQDKQAILNGVLARTNNNKKAKFILKSEHEANFIYPYLFLISDKDKCYTDWYNEYLNSKQDKFNSSIVELWKDKPEPFDLERALAGEPVMLRNGLKAHILKQIKDTLIGYFDECTPFSWELNGDADRAADSNHDIIGMWKEPEPVSNTVTLTLPCPLKELKNEMWFIGSDGVVFKSDFQKDNPKRTCNMDKFNAGLYFGSEEDAQAWLDAMRNNRR